MSFLALASIPPVPWQLHKIKDPSVHPHGSEKITSGVALISKYYCIYFLDSTTRGTAAAGRQRWCS